MNSETHAVNQSRFSSIIRFKNAYQAMSILAITQPDFFLLFTD